MRMKGFEDPRPSFLPTIRQEIWRRSRSARRLVLLLSLPAAVIFCLPGLEPDGSPDLIAFSYVVAVFLAIGLALALGRGRDSLRRMLKRLPGSPFEELHGRLQVGLGFGGPLFLGLLLCRALLGPFPIPEALALTAAYLGILGSMICFSTVLSQSYEFFGLFFLSFMVLGLLSFGTVDQVPWLLLATGVLGYGFAVWLLPKHYRGAPLDWSLVLGHFSLSFFKFLVWAIFFMTSFDLLSRSWDQAGELRVRAFFCCLIGLPQVSRLLFPAKMPTAGPRLPREILFDLVVTFCWTVHVAFLVLAPWDPASVSAEDSSQKFFAWWVAVAFIAPLGFSFWATDVAAGWVRQEPLLKRLPPRPRQVARGRLRSLLQGVALSGLPLALISFFLLGYTGREDAARISIALLACVALNALGAALLVWFLMAEEFLGRVLLALVTYLGSLLLGGVFLLSPSLSGGVLAIVLVLLYASLGGWQKYEPRSTAATPG